MVSGLPEQMVGTRRSATSIEIAPGRSEVFGRLRRIRIRVRGGVADVLGLSGDPAALPMVEPMLATAIRWCRVPWRALAPAEP